MDRSTMEKHKIFISYVFSTCLMKTYFYLCVFSRSRVIICSYVGVSSSPIHQTHTSLQQNIEYLYLWKYFTCSRQTLQQSILHLQKNMLHPICMTVFPLNKLFTGFECNHYQASVWCCKASSHSPKYVIAEMASCFLEFIL